MRGLHGQTPRQLKQSVVTEFVAALVRRFADPIGVKDQEITRSEPHGALQILGAGDQPERDAFHRGLFIGRFVVQPIPSLLRCVIPQGSGMTDAGKNQLAGPAEIANHRCHGILYRDGKLHSSLASGRPDPARSGALATNREVLRQSRSPPVHGRPHPPSNP